MASQEYSDALPVSRKSSEEPLHRGAAGVDSLNCKRDKVARDVELMVFLKPTVTQTLVDVEKLMQNDR